MNNNTHTNNLLNLDLDYYMNREYVDHMNLNIVDELMK